MIILHDKRIPPEYLADIKGKIPDVEFIPFNGSVCQNEPKVYDSILSHPDIYFFQIEKNVLVYSPSVETKQLALLKDRRVELIKGQTVPFGLYPQTSGYNALRIGKYVFHNFRFTDSIVKAEIKKRKLKQIEVKQGYVRCSVLAVGDSALITSDHGVASAAQQEGFDVLQISAGSIMLPGEKYGFLGGTVGVLPDENIIFLGDIRLHPDFSGIEKIFKKYGVKYFSCEDLPLYDAGGLFVFT